MTDSEAESAQQLMRKAVTLGYKGQGLTSPNPPVGAVIARDGIVLGEGYHRRCGDAHAELLAIAEAQSKGGEDLRDATLYVTLEPCSSEGRTGACTRAIIDAGIGAVVVGSVDPDSRHQGRAQKILEAAGISVRFGVLEEECAFLIRGFEKVARKGLPWVIAKAGMTMDGRITRPKGEGQWITGEEARRDAMELRFQADAIVIGANTARVDNPKLTLRGEGLPGGKKQPWRVVLGNRESLPDSLHLFTDHEAERTKVLSGEDLSSLLGEMASWGVTTVLVEGGGAVLRAFFASSLVDEAIFYLAPRIGLNGLSVTGEAGEAGSGSVDLRFGQVSKIGEDLRIQAFSC